MEIITSTTDWFTKDLGSWILSSAWPWLYSFATDLKVVIVALTGAFFGHWLTTRQSKKRARNLENGLFFQINLLEQRFQSFLRDLVGELERPKTKTLTTFKPVKIDLIDQLVLELIGAGRMLTAQQTMLIMNLPAHLERIETTGLQRQNKVNEISPEDIYFIPSHYTAALIHATIDGIFNLSKFVSEKNAFALDRSENWRERTQVAFSRAGIEFDDHHWMRFINNLPANLRNEMLSHCD